MDYFSEEFNAIDIKFKALIDEKNTLIKNNDSLKKKICELINENKNLLEECDNYNKVSVVKNLHNQIHEKDNIIKLLQKKIKSLKELEKKNIIMTTTSKEHDYEEQTELDVAETEAETEAEAEAEAEEAEAEEAEEAEAAEAEEAEAEEEEIEFYEKRLKPKNSKGRVLFLITDDEHKDIYQRDDNGEPGEHIGKLVGKQNKPFFF